MQTVVYNRTWLVVNGSFSARQLPLQQLCTMSGLPSHIPPAGPMSGSTDIFTTPPATKPVIHREPTAKVGMSLSLVQETGPERLRGGVSVSAVSESPSVGFIHCPSGRIVATVLAAAAAVTVVRKLTSHYDPATVQRAR